VSTTQRPNEAQQSSEALARRRAERRVEQAEARFETETPAWGGVHPTSGEWELPQRSTGETTGFWEHTPENWGIVERSPAEGQASWTDMPTGKIERKPSSGLDPYTRQAINLIRRGGASAVRRVRPTPSTTPTLPDGRKRGPGRNTATLPAMGYPHPTP
jgi:hypothetical protein